jgi:hypothetical protein
MACERREPMADFATPKIIRARDEKKLLTGAKSGEQFAPRFPVYHLRSAPLAVHAVPTVLRGASIAPHAQREAMMSCTLRVPSYHVSS